MTEELEKEAMDYANKWLEGVKDLELYHNKTDPKPKYIRIKEAYLAGAEPREKRIAELEATIRNTKAVDESFALQTIQLTKAKQIIKILKDDLSMYSGNYQKEIAEAEQFLEENSISEHIQRATHNYMG